MIVLLLTLMLPAIRTDTQAPNIAAQDAMSAARSLLFGIEAATPPLVETRGTGRTNVCATSEAAKALYPGTGINAVTRDNPFMPYPELNGGICSVYYHATPVEVGDRLNLVYGTCTIGIRNEQRRQVIDIAPRSGVIVTRFVLSECFYRVALYIEGYRGALAASTERMFVSTARGFWAGQVQFVGPVATTIPTWLSQLCPDLKTMYYQNDFAERAARLCIPRNSSGNPSRYEADSTGR